MERIEIKGDVLEKTSHSDQVPKFITDKIPDKRYLDTIYGVFEIDRNDQIQDQVQNYRLTRINFDEFEKTGTLKVSLIKSNDGRLYYETASGSKGEFLFTESDYYLLNTSNLDIDSDTPTVIKISESFRVNNSEDSLLGKIESIVETQNSIGRNRRYIIEPSNDSMRKIILKDSEIQDLVDNDSLIKLEKIN